MQLCRTHIVIALAVLTLFLTGCKEEPLQEGVTIFENGYYFNGDSMIAFKELAIQNTTIISISNKKSKTNAQRVDVSGKYIIPGLVDAHVHLAGSPSGIYTGVDPAYNAASSLRCGVTTVVDLFFEEARCKTFKETTKSYPGKYATVILSGPILTAPHGHGTEYGVETRTLVTKPETERITNEVIDNGADVIKLVYQAYSNKHAISKRILETIVTTAHKRGVKVFAHIDVTEEAMDCIDAGVDILAHIPGNHFTNEQLERMEQSRILTIPTFSVVKSFYMGHGVSFSSDSLLWQTAHPDHLSKIKHDVPVSALYFDTSRAFVYWNNLKKLIEKKLPIVAGTDAGNYAVFYGYSLHNEIDYYVLAGMTPAEALNSATRNILALFPDRSIGKIEPGYNADLVILNKNPLVDIRNTKSIYSVYHKGIKVHRENAR